MFAATRQLAQQMLGAVDLAIEFATLGEYGLEQREQRCGCGRCRAAGDRDQRRGREAAWEALTIARPRGACRPARIRRRMKNSHPEGWLSEKPAATYSPRRLPAKYHRR